MSSLNHVSVTATIDASYADNSAQMFFHQRNTDLALNKTKEHLLHALTSPSSLSFRH